MLTEGVGVVLGVKIRGVAFPCDLETCHLPEAVGSLSVTAMVCFNHRRPTWRRADGWSEGSLPWTIPPRSSLSHSDVSRSNQLGNVRRFFLKLMPQMQWGNLGDVW